MHKPRETERMQPENERDWPSSCQMLQESSATKSSRKPLAGGPKVAAAVVRGKRSAAVILPLDLLAHSQSELGTVKEAEIWQLAETPVRQKQQQQIATDGSAGKIDCYARDRTTS